MALASQGGLEVQGNAVLGQIVGPPQDWVNSICFAAFSLKLSCCRTIGFSAFSPPAGFRHRMKWERYLMLDNHFLHCLMDESVSQQTPMVYEGKPREGFNYTGLVTVKGNQQY